MTDERRLTLDALIAKVQWVRKFIEYARYELQPGEQQMGDQFPRQSAADKAMGLLDELASALRADAGKVDLSAALTSRETPVNKCLDVKNANVSGGAERLRADAGGKPAEWQPIETRDDYAWTDGEYEYRASLIIYRRPAPPAAPAQSKGL